METASSNVGPNTKVNCVHKVSVGINGKIVLSDIKKITIREMLNLLRSKLMVERSAAEARASTLDVLQRKAPADDATEPADQPQTGHAAVPM